MREFPLLGVLIANDGYTIVEVTQGGPADEAGIETGDAIIGYDGALWQTAPDVIALLANYTPGETLNLYIQRGAERFNAPVVLGARLIAQPPLWLPQRVDLTPYAGETILLRFDYISLPGHEDQGVAVDNIAIPEIDFYDDAESEFSWDMIGWSQIDNRVEQPMIVQAVTTGTANTPPRVRHLIDPTSEASEGKWTFSLGAGETLLIAVSGASDETRERAVYDLALEVVE